MPVKPAENSSDDNLNNDKPLDFVRQIIADDVANGVSDGRVHTRFPPEPNGYLHIGHAKSICLNFGIASEYEQGKCNLRFDDTNPTKEDSHYVDAITADINWLGFVPEGDVKFASNYFEQMYQWATELITKGKAYVCQLNGEDTRMYRGSLTEKGKDSPYRNRSVDENLDLFKKMKSGAFENGTHTLRAKIDMGHDNMNMRDPVMYRLLNEAHHRPGDTWHIYPMYDWAHVLEDAIEGITHSICTLEFEDHRPLYDWYIDNIDGLHHPRQYEFARLNLAHTVMSKRKLLRLVEENKVKGWDDPRMPTISGMRRRGYSPESIRDFCKTIGVTKYNSKSDFKLLELCIRKDLNAYSPRVMGVIDPLKLVITNYPEDQEELFETAINPGDDTAGVRQLPFSKTLWIQRDDFMEDAPKKFFRLSVGREVRLRCAYFVTCTDVVKDDNGNIIEVHCTYDPATKGGDAPDGRKVKGTMHWVSAKHAVSATVNMYDHLFLAENPEAVDEGVDFVDTINPDSVKVLKECYIEAGISVQKPGYRCQFERLGYFCIDTESTADHLIMNHTISLREAKGKK
jgi:glutaminyl-tRNA synthetase